MGYRDSNDAMPGSPSGGGFPAELWSDYMRRALEKTPVRDFPEPTGDYEIVGEPSPEPSEPVVEESPTPDPEPSTPSEEDPSAEESDEALRRELEEALKQAREEAKEQRRKERQEREASEEEDAEIDQASESP
jgi:membrane carboxypeptidase/penicillin-binding protein